MEAFHHPTTFGIPFPYGFPNTAAVMNICGGPPTNFMPSSSISIWMDCRIWSRLPQRLVDRIIAFLPVPAFFRARSVCKRWYSLLFSTSFLELYLQVSPHSPWFIFFKHKNQMKSNIYSSSSYGGCVGSRGAIHEEGYLFDPHALAWYRISLPLIPPGFSPATSSGGLIAWVSQEAGSKNILLSNPLVGSLVQIPPTLRPRLFPSIGMNIRETSIDLAVAGDDLISPYAVKNLTAESFHIDANGFYSIWGTASSLPRLSSFESGQMVHSEGRFYCMNYNPFSVLCHDISSNSWCKIQAPMRRFLRSPSLVECGGRLVMVAAVEKSNLNVPRSLRMWALQDGCGVAWVEIERMPQQLYGQFVEAENGEGFECVGHGEFVVITIKRSSGGGKASVMFDFRRKRWVWVPPCPYGGGGGGGEEELHGFAYEPRLAAPITALLDQLTLPFQSFTA